MLGAVFLFASMDAGVKYLVKHYPVVQVVWARYFFHLVLLTAVFAKSLPVLVKTTNLKIQIVRSILLLATTALFFTGLRFVPLADMTAIMMVAPLIVTALSMPLLKEPVGPRRWLGVVVGFAGALIIIRPTSGVMQLAALLPLAAAASYALYQISTRHLSSSDPVLTTLLYSATSGAVLTSFLVPFYWTWPTPMGWALLLYTGFCGGFGHFALIKAFTSAPAAVITPFSYTSLIWATGWGFFVYGEFPDHWTIVGAAIIALSGLYVFFREQRVKAHQQS
jgi:drug/metabolite transporter (DMT)-like permease